MINKIPKTKNKNAAVFQHQKVKLLSASIVANLLSMELHSSEDHVEMAVFTNSSITKLALALPCLGKISAEENI